MGRPSLLPLVSIFPQPGDSRLTKANLRKADLLVGASAHMRKVHAAIELASRSLVPVCVTGESGTGKELVARIVHALSPSGDSPLVAINCSAVPDQLFESEFFGHEKGAFTGAHTARDGVFARADGGTLLLDEVAELRLDHQAKLLRAIQFQEFQPVGGKTRLADVRLICATHRDLRAEVAAGRFRQDLYYRIRVMPIHLPNLQSRIEDIPRLAAHLLRTFDDAESPRFIGLTEPALRRLESETWPGNIRQLSNVIQRAMLVAKGDLITESDLPRETDAPVAPQEAFDDEDVDLDTRFTKQKKKLVDDFERKYAEAMLSACDHNITQAAFRAGMDRKSFWKLLRRLGLVTKKAA